MGAPSVGAIAQKLWQWLNGDITLSFTVTGLADWLSGTTTTAKVNIIAQPGVDIGDVTVNNAAGAAAVNVQDGGNALTVDWAGAAPPIGAGTEAAALRVTVATDSTGSVGVTSLPALPAGTNTIGNVITNLTQMADGQGKTLFFPPIDVPAGATTEIISADASNLFYVVGFAVGANVAGTFKFTDGIVDQTGTMPVGATGGYVVMGQPSSPLFKTGAINRALSITTVTCTIDGFLIYYKAAS